MSRNAPRMHLECCRNLIQYEKNSAGMQFKCRRKLSIAARLQLECSRDTIDDVIYTIIQSFFLPRKAMLSAVFAVVVCLSVCLCVCLSHSGIVSKRLNVGSRKQRRTIGFSSEMFCSCRISTDKCLAQSLCNSRASCLRSQSALTCHKIGKIGSADPE